MNAPEKRPPGPDIQVNQVGEWPLPRDLLVAGVRAVLDRAQVFDGELSLTFLDDQGIQALNRNYFGKNRPTDVIAFALQDPETSVLGDVYVGYHQAERQAEDEGVPLEEELLRLAIHGTLHVLGYEHPVGDDREKSEMFLLQEEILRETLRSG